MNSDALQLSNARTGLGKHESNRHRQRSPTVSVFRMGDIPSAWHGDGHTQSSTMGKFYQILSVSLSDGSAFLAEIIPE